MSADELKAFYKARAKKPDLFTYDDDGNLVELNKEGSVVKTIPLPEYRSPTLEEFDEMEKNRMTAVAAAQKEVTDAYKELQQLLSQEEYLKSDALRLNRKVKEADIKLLATRFPLRFVSLDPFSFPIKDIEFDKSYEKRKYPYSHYFLQENPFTLQEQYVRVGKAAVKPSISVAEAKAAEDNAIKVILFAQPDTNDYGFLSLDWSVELEFNGTMYHSAKQALAAELAKGFNDEENLQRIMTTESATEITYDLSNVPGDADANEPKWNDLTKRLLYDINIVKFNQYPELAGRLLETKNAQLGAYIPDDNLLGIGISIDNVQAQNPVNWTGQNLLGKALMDIRQKMRSDRELAEQQAAAEQPKPVVRRRKPAVATAVPPSPAPATSVPPEVMSQPAAGPPPEEELGTAAPPPPEAIAQPQGGPRPIRRKPGVAPQPTV
jgi:ribA/ribD-fused uncharacterized protein